MPLKGRGAENGEAHMSPGLGAPKLLDILTLLGHKELGMDLGHGAKEPSARAFSAGEFNEHRGAF